MKLYQENFHKEMTTISEYGILLGDVNRQFNYLHRDQSYLYNTHYIIHNGMRDLGRHMYPNFKIW